MPVLAAAPPVRRLIDRRREESVGGHRCQSTTSWRRWGVFSRESEYEKKFTAEDTRGESKDVGKCVIADDWDASPFVSQERKKNVKARVRSFVCRESSDAEDWSRPRESLVTSISR